MAAFVRQRRHRPQVVVAVVQQQMGMYRGPRPSYRRPRPCPAADRRIPARRPDLASAASGIRRSSGASAASDNSRLVCQVELLVELNQRRIDVVISEVASIPSISAQLEIAVQRREGSRSPGRRACDRPLRASRPGTARRRANWRSGAIWRRRRGPPHGRRDWRPACPRTPSTCPRRRRTPPCGPRGSVLAIERRRSGRSSPRARRRA